jgi:hypothetical protein
MDRLTHYPKVSFVTATYNRAPAYLHLVEEAVECFRRNALDYPGESEMVLLNDAGGQELFCDLPGVRVVNETRRYSSLGEKLNAAIAHATGEVILPADDDDLSLPWRARLSVWRLAGADYFNPRAYWFLCGGKLVHEQRTGYAHNCSAFRKDAWAGVGGYPPLSGPQDAAMDGLLRRHCRVVEGPLAAEESVFIYRWGCSDLHLSGQSDTAAAYRDWGRRPVAPGRFEIVPRFRPETEAVYGRLAGR